MRRPPAGYFWVVISNHVDGLYNVLPPGGQWLERPADLCRIPSVVEERHRIPSSRLPSLGPCNHHGHPRSPIELANGPEDEISARFVKVATPFTQAAPVAHTNQMVKLPVQGDLLVWSRFDRVDREMCQIAKRQAFR